MDCADDVFTRAKTRIGQLAERVVDPTLSASDADDKVLGLYLDDGLSELAKRTDRMSGSVELTAAAGDASLDLPAHIDHILEAHIDDGTSRVEIETVDGAPIAAKAKGPGATEGSPTKVGTHAAKLWLWPVPDQEYTLALEVTLNGYWESIPMGEGAGPRLDELVRMVPPELERALVAFVVAEWFDFKGEAEVAQLARRRYERGVQRYDTDPRGQTTATRDYNPLGL